ncbi:MAG: hypothetical protein ACOC0F_02470 [archaeon]
MTDESASADEDGPGLSRRGFVAANAAGWSSVALAGCSALSPAEEDTETETEAPAQTETETETEPKDYVVTDDVITGSEYVPEGFDGFASSCAPSRTFVPGMEPVFKVGVYDPETGDSVGTDVLDAVNVNIDGGPTAELEWVGDAEEDPAREWSGTWLIPDDAEPDTYDYTVEVTNDDADFHDVGILESSINVIEYNDPRNYVVTDEVYAGSGGIPDDNEFVSSCAPTWTFGPGMMVGWDIGIYEGRTGNPVGPVDFEEAEDYDVVQGVESVTLTIEQFDETIDLEWAGGEDDEGEMVEDWYWNNVWTIPEDAEAQTVDYSIEVESEVSTTPVGVLEESFTIVEP